MKTYDCEPTLTDRQVIQFCRDGYLELTAAVPRDVTHRALDYLAGHPDQHDEPSPLLDEAWFMDHLVVNPQVAGAVRSLLGANFGLPWIMPNHAGKCPESLPLGWHVDGGNMHTFALNYLQVFCLLQDTTVEMGPTELLPGSHFLLGQSALVGHYGAIRGTKKAIGPAGTVFITCYPIWHRRSKATATGPIRHMLKYNYFRNSPPRRDWIVEPDFDPARHVNEFNHLRTGAQLLRRNFLDSYDAARMYLWLCGHQEEFKYIGSWAWPAPVPESMNGQTEAYAVPPSLIGNDRPIGYHPTAKSMLSRE